MGKGHERVSEMRLSHGGMVVRVLRPREALRFVCSTAPAPAPAPAPSAPAPSSASSAASDVAPKSDKDAFASRDIAFKPNSDGWGYTSTYASGWDRIFKQSAGKLAQESAPAPPVPASFRAKLRALDEARALGAISDDLYERARAELRE